MLKENSACLHVLSHGYSSALTTHLLVTLVVALWVGLQEGRLFLEVEVLQDVVHVKLLLEGHVVQPHGGGQLQVVAAGTQEPTQQVVVWGRRERERKVG